EVTAVLEPPGVEVVAERLLIGSDLDQALMDLHEVALVRLLGVLGPCQLRIERGLERIRTRKTLDLPAQLFETLLEGFKAPRQRAAGRSADGLGEVARALSVLARGQRIEHGKALAERRQRMGDFRRLRSERGLERPALIASQGRVLETQSGHRPLERPQGA